MIIKLFNQIFPKKLYECPICEKKFKTFLPFGFKPRPNAQCPVCKSLERHRLIWLYFRERTDLLKNNYRMLHIAPEPQISKRLKNLSNIDYLSADLSSLTAMVKMDLTNIQYPDNSFDVIYASHVLEHIPDDRKAMRELSRVLRPNGWAILQVPMWGKKTIEDPNIKTPEERGKVYGQDDHVRLYGFDGKYKERLEEAGFKVKIDPYVKTMGHEKVKRFGLMESEYIYYCTK